MMCSCHINLQRILQKPPVLAIRVVESLQSTLAARSFFVSYLRRSVGLPLGRGAWRGLKSFSGVFGGTNRASPRSWLPVFNDMFYWLPSKIQKLIGFWKRLLPINKLCSQVAAKIGGAAQASETNPGCLCFRWSD